MRRVAKEQIEVTLLFEAVSAGAALSIAVVIKVLGLFLPVFQIGPFKT